MIALGNLTRSAVNLADLDRIEACVRKRFSIPDTQIVLVGEDHSRLSDGPARMTTILFWTDTATRHKVRLFKPAADIRPDDLPPAWLRGALLDNIPEDCC